MSQNNSSTPFGTGVTLVLTIADFRLMFSAFKNPIKYPDILIQAFYNDATNFISDEDFGTLNGQARQTALYRMTAHLMQLDKMNREDEGAPAANIQSASVDKVRVDLTPPTEKSEFASWLAFTSYGQTLWAQLNAASVGGFYVSGSPYAFNSGRGFCW